MGIHGSRGCHVGQGSDRYSYEFTYSFIRGFMPVTFSQIAAGTAKVTIQTSVGAVTVEYYPNKITEKLIAKMRADQDADTPMTEFIKSWDIYEDAEFTVMTPIEDIAKFGIPFKVQVMEAVMGDIRPNSA